MSKKAKILLDELMKLHPEWGWDELENRAFVEIMQAFKDSPEDDQQSTTLSLVLVKDFIHRLLAIEEKKRLRMVPQKLSFKNRLFNMGYQAGIKNMQLRGKSKKTRIEKGYVIIADEFNLDIESVILIYSLANGYGRTKEEIIKWANKKAYENRGNSLVDYYLYLESFLKRLSPEDFKFFVDKPKKEDLAEGVKEVPVIDQSIETFIDQAKLDEIEYNISINGKPDIEKIQEALEKEGDTFPLIENKAKHTLSILTMLESWEDARKVAKKEKIKKLRKVGKKKSSSKIHA